MPIKVVQRLFCIPLLLALFACAGPPLPSPERPAVLYKADTHAVQYCTGDGLNPDGPHYWHYRYALDTCLAIWQKQGYERVQ